MPQSSGGIDVEIEGNTLTVANEMYHLGNISRVSTYTHLVGFHGSPLQAFWSKKRGIIFMLIFLAIGSSVRGGGFFLALFAVTAAITGYQIWRMLTKKSTEYVLRLESAGVVRGVLGSEDPAAIERLVDEITKAIRKPPITAQHLSFPNARKIENLNLNQHGDHSIGIQQGA